MTGNRERATKPEDLTRLFVYPPDTGERISQPQGDEGKVMTWRKSVLFRAAGNGCRKTMAFGAIVAVLTLAACSGGGGGGSSITAVCNDYLADRLITHALGSLPLLVGSMPSESAADLTLAATKASTLAAEAPSGTITIPAMGAFDVKQTFTDAATLLTSTATKVTNGDRTGYVGTGLSTEHLAEFGAVCLGQPGVVVPS